MSLEQSHNVTLSCNTSVMRLAAVNMQATTQWLRQQCRLALRSRVTRMSRDMP